MVSLHRSTSLLGLAEYIQAYGYVSLSRMLVELPAAMGTRHHRVLLGRYSDFALHIGVVLLLPLWGQARSWSVAG